MPPQLALLLTTGFVIFLFRWEAKNGPRPSGSILIPLLWLLITGSRFVSQWFAVWGLPLGSGGSEDGSFLDAAVFMGLILAGILVLIRRRIPFRSYAKVNVWFVIFFAYCLLAILWSDFPFVAFKRWIKILGHPVMALIVLTDANPEAAFRSLIRKTAYVLLPYSVMLIKYYPHIGRGFEAWSGMALNMGVGLNKNCLGFLCMIFGVFFFWNLVQARRIEDRKAKRQEMLVTLGILYLIWWLLSMAQSATSLACLVLGIGTLIGLGFRWVSKRYFGTYLLVAVLSFGVIESVFGVYASVVEMLGRDPTLTDRTEVWADVLQLVEDPILGAGFESFWLGERLEILWDKWSFMPNQAHNGYIETYINLGWIGVIILAGMIVFSFRHIQDDLVENFEFGRLRMAYLFVILIYNYTEATFKAVAFVWTIFHLIAMSQPRRAPSLAQEQTTLEEEPLEPAVPGGARF